MINLPSNLQIIGLAAVAVAIVSGVAYIKGRSDGAHMAKIQALKTINAQLKERAETDAEINETDLAGLCALLGGKWVSEHERCD